MIRWSYVLPRLAVGIGVLSAMALAVDPAARRLITHFGRSVLRAQLDLERINASLLPPRLTAYGVQLAKQDDAARNLVEAKRIGGELDLLSLMKKKVVVNKLFIDGVRIGEAHETSQTVGPGIELPKIPNFELAWLDDAEAAFHHNLNLDFETPALIRHSARKWKRTYSQMQSQTKRLQTAAKGLVLESELPTTPPSARRYAELASEVGRVRLQLKSLQEELAQIPDAVNIDRSAIDAARKRDLEQIRSRLQLTALDAKSLTEFFLGTEQSQMLSSLLGWLEWGRRYMPLHKAGKPIVRHRGIDVRFASQKATPDFLLKSAVMRGSIAFAGQDRAFLGRISNVSDKPTRHTQPTILLLKLVDDSNVMVKFTLDRTSDVPRERILVNAPAWQTKTRTFGNPDKLAIIAAPSKLHFWLDAEVKGSELQGTIITRAQDLVLSPMVGSRLGGSRIAEQLQQAVRDLHEVETRLVLSGSIDNPQFRIESDFGRQLDTVIAPVFHNEIERQRNELVADLTAEIQESLADFDQQIRQSQMQTHEAIMVQEQLLAGLNRRVIQQSPAISNLTGGRISLPKSLGR